MFIQSIANYRALAIIFIVMGHLYGYGFVSEDPISSVIKNILTGGTALFVFISGFMFHGVFYTKFDYKKFMLTKFKNIIIPYCILASVAILGLFIIQAGYFSSDTEYVKNALFIEGDSALIIFIKYFLSGRFLIAYWYIPFVILLFSMSNLHVKFIQYNLRHQLLIIAALSVISIFIHRPIENINPLQSVIYYTPIYLIGIVTSLYSVRIKRKLNHGLIYLFIMIVGLLYIQYYMGFNGNFHKPMFEYGGLDLMFIQKLLLCLFLYLLLEKVSFNNKIVNVISKTSFAIFFIHPWFIQVFGKIYKNIYGIEEVLFVYSHSLLVYIAMTFVTLTFSIVLALVIKKICKNDKRTRYLIGY